jgi:hypothetical protein
MVIELIPDKRASDSSGAVKHEKPDGYDCLRKLEFIDNEPNFGQDHVRTIVTKYQLMASMMNHR